MSYVLVQDNDCHWYVIPEDKQEDWEKLFRTADNEYVPDYAEAVGGAPNRVVFEKYQII